jgi:hypothetical protein
MIVVGEGYRPWLPSLSGVKTGQGQLEMQLKIERNGKE